MGSQNTSAKSRDKSWCHWQWPHRPPEPYNGHQHSEVLVWSYAHFFPVWMDAYFILYIVGRALALPQCNVPYSEERMGDEMGER